MKQMTRKIYTVAVGTLLASVLINGMVNRHFSVVDEAQASKPDAALVANAASPQGGYVDLTYAAERSVEAVVHIKVTQKGQVRTVQSYDPFADIFGFPFGGGRQQRQVQEPDQHSSGSGVIISTDGYIVTNNHVVNGADVIDVKLNDNREFKGRIIGTDPTTDLALIKIEGKDLPILPIGDSDKLKVGQWVLAVGNPFNLTSTVTAGIVSAKARTVGANGVESFIQTDAAINRGNSGGALVNEQGELVGINAMLYSETGSYTGYGFAIPTTIMNKVVADLKEFGTVQRAVLGIQGGDVTNYIDSEKAKGNDPDLGTVTGVYVNEVSDGTAAAQLGLQKGDVITAIDGKTVNKLAEMQEELSKHRPGDKVSVTYMRNKKSKTDSVTLLNAQGTTTVLESVDLDVLGAALRPLSDETLRQLGLRYGLEVQAVKAGKMKDAGVTKGLIILMVNNRPMKTVEDFEQAVKDANMSSERELWMRAITPSGRKCSVYIDLQNEKDEKQGKK